jgi:hypothetical protein
MMFLRRLARALASVVALATLCAFVVPATAGASTETSTQAKKLSTAACDGFADYFTIEFLVAFASAFAGFGGDPGTGGGGSAGASQGAKGADGKAKEAPPTPEEIQDIFHLIFSPKLQAVTALLARESPRSIQQVFARQQAVFTRGVDILEGLGLKKQQLAELAKLDLSPNTDVSGVLGKVDLSKAKLRAAAKDFGRDAGALDLNGKVSRVQQRAFQQTGTQCGVFPASPVPCKSLVAADVAAPLVGGTPTVKLDQGSCVFDGPAEPGADQPVMVVDLYRTPRTYDRLVGQLQDPQQVDGDTVVADGFATFGHDKTCGKTLYGRTPHDTIVVAVCAPGDAEVTDAQLTGVRDAVAQAVAA